MLRTTWPSLAAILILVAACGPSPSATPATAAPTAVTTQQPSQLPTQVAATGAPTALPTAADPDAVYNTSFDSVGDPAASGITSNQTAIATQSKSGVRVNKSIVHSGTQSLEAVGTIGAPANSTMSIDIPVRDLIGQNTVDVSGKVLGVSVFIPKGSAIDNVYFAFSAGGQSALIPVRATGQPDPKGRWFSDDINIARFFDVPSARDAYSQDKNVTKGILWSCATISFVGQRSASGPAFAASFIVDDLRWAPVPYTLDSIPVDKNVDSLRKYADLHNIKIGSLVLDYGTTDFTMDPRYVQTLAQEFNLVSGITSQWPEQQPSGCADMNLDYTQQDQISRLGAGGQLAVKGATGGWYLQLPKWIYADDFHGLQAPLECRVETDLTHYRGTVPYWDVFNEVVDDDGAGLRNRQKKGPSQADWVPYGYHYSPWVDGSDTSLIRAAFAKARQADPAAKLYLNDYQNDQVGSPKAETFYRLVADMKKSGVPVDGVGFQLRFSIDGNNVIWPKKSVDSFLQSVKASVKRYADLGVSVEFSEVEVGIRINDIDFSTAAGKSLYAKRLADQAKVYGGLAKIAVESKNVSQFIVWLVSDRYPQNAVESGYGDTSLLDTEYKPKPAYYAVLDELKQP